MFIPKNLGTASIEESQSWEQQAEWLNLAQRLDACKIAVQLDPSAYLHLQLL